MKVLSITVGRTGLYRGSSVRDSALAAELRRMGHDVTLVPMLAPPLGSDHGVGPGARVLFGRNSVYLQSRWPLFRRTPLALDHLWDSHWAIRTAADRFAAVGADSLGRLVVALLEGPEGPLAKEFRKLERWLASQPRYDVICIPSALMISLAPVIRRVQGAPITVALQGEDHFLGNVPDAYRSRSIELIQSCMSYADAWVAVSDWYADHMSAYFGLPRERVHAVPIGVRTDDYALAPARDDGVFRAGYLARIEPGHGLHLLVQAWREFRLLHPQPAVLEVAGYVAPQYMTYLNSIRAQLDQWGLGDDFVYRGELKRAERPAFLSSLDAFCVPATYDDPKGRYVLEAMASGVPVIAPARGALLEHVNTCEGGLLVAPDDAASIAEALLELAENPVRARALGATGHLGVAQRRSLSSQAKRTLSVYHSLLNTERETVNA